MTRLCIRFCAIVILSAGFWAVMVVAQNAPVNQFPHKFDEFANINCEDELARLDSFAIELQNNPNLRGYVIIYGARRGRRNEANARAARMRYYLVHSRGLNKSRIFTLDGGFREKLMGELWVSAPGASPPIPTPTVRASEVKLKGRVKVYGYNCGDAMGGL